MNPFFGIDSRMDSRHCYGAAQTQDFSLQVSFYFFYSKIASEAKENPGFPFPSAAVFFYKHHKYLPLPHIQLQRSLSLSLSLSPSLSLSECVWLRWCAFVIALVVQKYLLTGTTVQILADSYQEHVPW